MVHELSKQAMTDHAHNVFLEQYGDYGSSTDKRSIQEAFGYYAKCLLDNDRALNFLAERKITTKKLLKEHCIGFSDRTLGLALGKLPKYEEQSKRGSLQRTGLIKSSGHEFFRGAITCPVSNMDGEIVSAYGRRVTFKLRAGSFYVLNWINGSASFFNHQALVEFDEVIICKNPLDALVWLSHGFHNVLALISVNSYCEEHTALIESYDVRRVNIAFGTSQEELKAARNISQLNTTANIETRFLMLPDGSDACSFAMNNSAISDGFQEAYQHPMILD